MAGADARSGVEEAARDRNLFNYPQYKDLSEKCTVFEGLGAYYSGQFADVTLTGVGDPINLWAGAATSSLLPLLGVRPALGRWFLPGEDASLAGDDGASIVVISHGLWEDRFGGSPDALGRVITIDDRPYTIVGVLPPRFRVRWLRASFYTGFHDRGRRDVWFPIGAPGWRAGPDSWSYEMIGRLAPGVTVERARVETQAIVSVHPDAQGDARVFPRAAEETHGLGSPLVLLFSATAFLLFIACCNIATLSLAELEGRRQEIATRAALGARASRLVRLPLTESAILAFLGCAIGTALAFGGAGVLVGLAPPIPRLHEVGVDLRVLVFAMLLGTFAAFLFGAVTSIVVYRPAVAPELRRSAGARPARRRFSNAIIGFEIAMTVMLLVTGGLLTRSLSRLLAVDPGFDTSNLATVEVWLPNTRYATGQARAAFLRDVLGELEAIPSAGTVTGASSLPFPGRTARYGIRILERGPERVGSMFVYRVAPNYLESLGVPLLAGRHLEDADGPEAPLTVVINETMARNYWPGASPIGAQLTYGRTTATVVGIVGDMKKKTLYDEVEPVIYVPFSQSPSNRIWLVSRTQARPREMIPLMREAVWSVDRELAITNATTVAELVAQSAAQERYRTLLMNVFGILAALLAAAGVFGVATRSVAMRTREMGIRMVLGVRKPGLVWTTLQGVLSSGMVGMALGLVGAFWAGRSISSFLFDVEPSDPLTYCVVAALVVVVCLLATYLPTRRVLRVDPVDVLRVE